MTEQSQGKGRPTPKRSEAQKRRGGPVAPPPTNRREAARQLREKQAADRKSVRRANLTGTDDKLLLPRDRGPVRRLVRDVVDARLSLGFLLLPVALVVVVSGILKNPQLQAITFGIWMATIIGVVFDMVVATAQIRKAVRTTFPEEQKLVGHVAYGLLRTTVLRRFRMPRPQASRGQRP